MLKAQHSILYIDCLKDFAHLILQMITARKWSLRWLCFHRCLSVHGEVCVQGACIRVGVCIGGGGSASRGGWADSTSRQYTSYWNAFLLTVRMGYLHITVDTLAFKTVHTLGWRYKWVLSVQSSEPKINNGDKVSSLKPYSNRHSERYKCSCLLTLCYPACALNW